MEHGDQSPADEGTHNTQGMTYVPALHPSQQPPSGQGPADAQMGGIEPPQGLEQPAGARLSAGFQSPREASFRRPSAPVAGVAPLFPQPGGDDPQQARRPTLPSLHEMAPNSFDAFLPRPSAADHSPKQDISALREQIMDNIKVLSPHVIPRPYASRNGDEHRIVTIRDRWSGAWTAAWFCGNTLVRGTPPRHPSPVRALELLLQHTSEEVMAVLARKGFTFLPKGQNSDA